MPSPEILVRGEHWSHPYVLKRLRSLGVPERHAESIWFRVEHQFSILCGQRGCQAEWSIRFEEVMGLPEDLQFDLDELREAAIHDVAEGFVKD